MEVPREEPDGRPGHDRRKQGGRRRHAELAGRPIHVDEERDRRDRHQAGGEAVQPVDQVHGVDHRHHPKGGERHRVSRPQHQDPKPGEPEVRQLNAGQDQNPRSQDLPRGLRGDRQAPNVVDRVGCLRHEPRELQDGVGGDGRAGVIPCSGFVHRRRPERLGRVSAHDCGSHGAERHPEAFPVLVDGEAQARHRDDHGVAGADLGEGPRAADRFPSGSHDELTGGERRLLHANQELAPRYGPGLLAGSLHHYFGVVDGQYRERVARGRGRPQVASHGPSVADLRRSHRSGGLRQRSELGKLAHDARIGDACAEEERAVLAPPPAELLQPADVDDRVRPVTIEIELDHDVGPAGDGECLGTLALHLQRFVQRPGREYFHQNFPHANASIIAGTSSPRG